MKSDENHNSMTIIRNFVSEFFSCISCREHFLYYYDRCYFKRCEINPMDNQAVQVIIITNI